MAEIAYAQATESTVPAAGGMASFGQFVPLILIFVVFYFLLIRPQQKKAQEQQSFLGNLQTKIFHANGDPTTNNWSAESIGKTRQAQFYGGLSEAMARAGASLNQNAGGSLVFEYLVKPQEFTMLRTGGPECDHEVDAILFQGGRRWLATVKDKPTTQNFLRHTFPQLYQPTK